MNLEARSGNAGWTAESAVLALLTAFLGSGCGDDGRPRVNEAATPARVPSVLVSVIAGSAESRQIYVAAKPQIPSGELDLSTFREFGNVDVETHGGYVYVWDRETARVTQFGVADDLSLVEGRTVSFAGEGVADSQEWIFVSDTRAYVLAPDLAFVLVWNPSTMEISGKIPIELPERYQRYEETFFHKPQLVGDHVFWQVVSDDWDAGRIYHAATLAVMSATEGTPVRFVEDERCAGLNGGYVDAAGDYYVRADGYWGYLVAYAEAGPASVQTCVLRVRAGETEFDPAYFQSMEALTGSPVSFPWFHVKGSQYVAFPRDLEHPVPVDRDEYWNTRFVPLLVDVVTGNARPYPDLNGVLVQQSREYEVDDVAYFERSEGGNPNTVALEPDGVGESAFSSTGIWALKRIR